MFTLFWVRMDGKTVQMHTWYHDLNFSSSCTQWIRRHTLIHPRVLRNSILDVQTSHALHKGWPVLLIVKERLAVLVPWDGGGGFGRYLALNAEGLAVSQGFGELKLGGKIWAFVVSWDGKLNWWENFSILLAKMTADKKQKQFCSKPTRGHYVIWV